MNQFGKFLNPGSIALIGASRSPEKVGHQILKNIISNGYRGHLYPVNPNAKKILQLTCYPTLHQIPKVIDLAIIATPAPLVPIVLRECIQNHVQNAIIVTAGFAETGAKGKALQQELQDIIKGNNINILGPNCLGVLSPAFGLNAAFGPALPQKGSLGLISQSGALVTGIIDWANQYEIGLSHAITFGNRIGTGEIEALEYFAHDPHTKVILTYIESFQNAPKFFSACSRITPKKPVILLKGGQSALGQTASASHTAALASDYTLVEAFANQAGVILVDTLEQWLNVAAAFSQNPPSKGQAITILTNAGGPGVLSTDEATELGIDVPELSAKIKSAFHKSLPHINPHNPLDILGDATPEDIALALKILATDPNLSNLLILITPQTTTHPKRMAEAIAASPIRKKVPTFVVLIGGEKMEPAKKALEANHIMFFEFPTQALEVIAHTAAYETARRQRLRFPAAYTSKVAPKRREQLIHKLTSDLSLPTAFELLVAYGFRLPKSAVITNRSEVGETLSYVGRPAVAKTANLRIAHKAKVGGVMLNLMTSAQARIAFSKLEKLHPSVLFQQTIHGDLELIIGAKRDSQLGTFITVGWGGSLTNTYGDRAYAFIPTSKRYWAKVFAQTKAFKLMTDKNLPLDPVLQCLDLLTGIMMDLPMIQEIEINPAILTKKHLYAADVKITLAP